MPALPLIFPSLQFNAFCGLAPAPHSAAPRASLRNSLVAIARARGNRERSGRDAHVCIMADRVKAVSSVASKKEGGGGGERERRDRIDSRRTCIVGVRYIGDINGEGHNEAAASADFTATLN